MYWSSSSSQHSNPRKQETSLYPVNRSYYYLFKINEEGHKMIYEVPMTKRNPS